MFTLFWFGDGRTFVKRPDPHDEAIEILKDQMANPPKPVHTPIILNIYTPAVAHKLK